MSIHISSDKAPRPSISNVIWILSSDTICLLNQLFSNSEAAMLFRQECWSLANRGIVNALPWQQDFRGVDPNLSCLGPVVFYHACVSRNMLIVDCWPPHRQAFHLLPWRLLFWVNPFKGRLTLQLRIHELSNLIVITVISIFVPFSLFLQIFVLGHLFLQVAIPDYFRLDVAVLNYYFFLQIVPSKSFESFIPYHFFNSLQLFPLCKYQIVHIICF